MRIAILMEGETERVFLPHLREFLAPRLPGKMPKLIANKYDGRLQAGEVETGRGRAATRRRSGR